MLSSLPGLQGQDELLFQFCKSKGWPHARHVGTITPYQAWLALKKMGRDDYDVTKVLPLVLKSVICLRMSSYVQAGRATLPVKAHKATIER